MRAHLYLVPAILAATSVPAAAHDPRPTWTRLELEASKFFITARSDVELAARPSSEAVAELLDPARANFPLMSRRSDGGQGLTPRGAQSLRLDIRTRILSRDSKIRFWFDPGDARALQRSSHDRSKKRLRHRTYRYTRDGVLSHTRWPADGENDRPPDGWSQVDDHFVELGANGGAVTEPAGLLYLVSAGDFRAPGDRGRFHVFSRGQVREVDVAVAARERLEVDYVEVSGDGVRSVDRAVDALHVAVRPRATAGGGDSDFKLLGLEGDIDIYLDPDSRVPLLVRGKVDVAGKVRLRLRRAVLE